ncbi:hypothetical protein Taro_021231 [Colocasia esculenta]|uniref:Uncharacterized protein n=1 Tax=Colocasia esculenta TaxID=4460 RepID=A0A843UYD5_COLES|nr:hypothetical protein [Colocasia esculenta]
MKTTQVEASTGAVEETIISRRRIPVSSCRTMTTRGHRGVGPSRGDESAGGSQAPAQQAQEQTGVPLPPPPPPVDYGALMQGLVHAMQTQAQTTATLQAQIEEEIARSDSEREE